MAAREVELRLLRAFVVAGRGICLAPASAARYYARPGITYVDVPDAAPSVVAFAWSDRPGTPTPAAAAFVAAGVELADSAFSVAGLTRQA